MSEAREREGRDGGREEEGAQPKYYNLVHVIHRYKLL